MVAVQSQLSKRPLIVIFVAVAFWLVVVQDWQLVRNFASDSAFASKPTPKKATFQCLQCDKNSIISNLDGNFSDTAALHSLQKDTSNQRCVFCRHGTFSQDMKTPTHAHSISRKIVLEQNVSHLYFVGSSTFRQLYFNFVSSFRGDHNFTSHPIMEHPFHQTSIYTFNGTNDALFMKDQMLENPLFIAESRWKPGLRAPYYFGISSNTKGSDGSNIISGGKAILVIGNHFWNFEFSPGWKSTITNFFKLTAGMDESSMFWIDTWYRSHRKGHSTKKIVREHNALIDDLNNQTGAWFAEKQGIFVDPRNNTRRIHRINVNELINRAFADATEIFEGYKSEDGLHFQCNFKNRYPDPILNASAHTRQRLGNCTDLINDLILNEIYDILKQGS